LGHYILGKFNSLFYLQIIVLNTGKALGKGTFGKVKLANHTLTGEKVSLSTKFVMDMCHIAFDHDVLSIFVLFAYMLNRPF